MKTFTKNILATLILCLMTLTGFAQNNDVDTTKRELIRNSDWETVFPNVSFFIETDNQTLPASKSIVAIYKDSVYAMPTYFNILFSKIENVPSISVEKKIETFVEIYFYLTDTNLTLSVSDEFDVKYKLYPFNRKVEVALNNGENYYIMFNHKNNQIKYAQLFKNENRVSFIPLLTVSDASDVLNQNNLTITNVTGVLNVGITHYYVPVSNNGVATNNRITFNVTGLQPNQSNVRLRIPFDNNFILDEILNVNSQGEATYTWEPANDARTGIWMVRIDESETEITEFNNIRIVTEHLLTGTFPNTNNNYDYTIYYCDVFFATHTSGIPHAPVFAAIVQSALLESWQTQVIDWQLAQGCTNNRPEDADDNYEVIIVPGVPIPDYYHEPLLDNTTIPPTPIASFAKNGVNRLIAIRLNSYMTQNLYSSEQMRINVAVFHEFYHGISWSLNNSNGNDTWSWMVEGQARFLPSIKYENEEFTEAIQHLYPKSANSYLRDHLNTRLNELGPNDGYDYCIFWRFLYGNYTTGSATERMRIIRETCVGNTNHSSSATIETFMDSKLNNSSTFTSFDQAIMAFSEHLLYINSNNSTPHHCGEWIDANLVYQAPNQEINIDLGTTSTSEQGTIPSPFGIDLGSITNISVQPNTFFHIEGGAAAEWGVNVVFFQSENSTNKINFTVKLNESDDGYFCIPETFGNNVPINLVRISICRLDADDNLTGSDCDYTISWSSGHIGENATHRAKFIEIYNQYSDILGLPTQNSVSQNFNHIGGLECQKFQSGAIVYNPITQKCYFVGEGIYNEWIKDDKIFYQLGMPLTSEYKDNAPTCIDFDGGRISAYENSGNWTFEVESYFSNIVENNSFAKYVGECYKNFMFPFSNLATNDLNKAVSRGKISQILVLAALAAGKIEGSELRNHTYKGYYSDVPENNPYSLYIEMSKEEGWTTTTGTFGTNGFVTREQISAFVVRVFDIPTPDYTLYSSPISSLEIQGRGIKWNLFIENDPNLNPLLKDAVKTLYFTQTPDKGEYLISGAETNTNGIITVNFNPKNNITIGQLSKFIYNGFLVASAKAKGSEITNFVGDTYEQPEINFTNPPSELAFGSGSTMTSTTSEGEIIFQYPTATDEDGDELFFFWSVSNGTLENIINNGQEVKFTAPQITTPEYINMYVLIGDGKGNISTGEFIIGVGDGFMQLSYNEDLNNRVVESNVLLQRSYPSEVTITNTGTEDVEAKFAIRLYGGAITQTIVEEVTTIAGEGGSITLRNDAFDFSSVAIGSYQIKVQYSKDDGVTWIDIPDTYNPYNIEIKAHNLVLSCNPALNNMPMAKRIFSVGSYPAEVMVTNNDSYPFTADNVQLVSCNATGMCDIIAELNNVIMPAHGNIVLRNDAYEFTEGNYSLYTKYVKESVNYPILQAEISPFDVEVTSDRGITVPSFKYDGNAIVLNEPIVDEMGNSSIEVAFQYSGTTNYTTNLAVALHKGGDIYLNDFERKDNVTFPTTNGTVTLNGSLDIAPGDYTLVAKYEDEPGSNKWIHLATYTLKIYDPENPDDPNNPNTNTYGTPDQLRELVSTGALTYSDGPIMITFGGQCEVYPKTYGELYLVYDQVKNMGVRVVNTGSKDTSCVLKGYIWRQNQGVVGFVTDTMHFTASTGNEYEFYVDKCRVISHPDQSAAISFHIEYANPNLVVPSRNSKLIRLNCTDPDYCENPVYYIFIDHEKIKNVVVPTSTSATPLIAGSPMNVTFECNIQEPIKVELLNEDGTLKRVLAEATEPDSLYETTVPAVETGAYKIRMTSTRKSSVTFTSGLFYIQADYTTPPVADFSMSPNPPCPGTEATITYNGTGGTPTDYQWTFPPEVQITNQTAGDQRKVIFPSVATYEISVTVINNSATPSTKNKSIDIVSCGSGNIAFSPNPLIFTDISVGTAPRCTLWVENNLSNEIRIESLRLTNNTVFKLEYQEDYTIPAKDKRPILITFTPTESGNFTDEVKMSISNNGSFEQYSCSIKGNAIGGVTPLVVGDDYPDVYKNSKGCPSEKYGCTGPLYECTADTWGFFRRECTSFVAWRMNRDAGYSSLTGKLLFTNTSVNEQSTYLGNAINWANSMQALGFRVDNNPEVGCIAWFNIGEYGHVAYVSSVNTDGSANIEEYNWTVNCQKRGQYNPRNNVIADKYIHFNTGVINGLHAPLLNSASLPANYAILPTSMSLTYSPNNTGTGINYSFRMRKYETGNPPPSTSPNGLYTVDVSGNTTITIPTGQVIFQDDLLGNGQLESGYEYRCLVVATDAASGLTLNSNTYTFTIGSCDLPTTIPIKATVGGANLAGGTTGITVAPGSDLLLKANITNNGYTFEWHKGGLTVPPTLANTLSYSINNIQLANAGGYYVKVISAACSRTGSLNVNVGESTNIAGKVYNVMVDAPNSTLSEPALSNCSVQLLNSSGDVINQFTTNYTGEFQFNNLLPGTYKLKATISKSDAQGNSRTSTVIYDNIVTGSYLDVRVPIDLHLQLVRAMKLMQVIPGAINDLGYNTQQLNSQIDNWLTISNNHDEVIEQMWNLYLILRVQTAFNGKVPILTEHGLSYAVDIFEPLTGCLMLVRDLQKVQTTANLDPILEALFGGFEKFADLVTDNNDVKEVINGVFGSIDVQVRLYSGKGSLALNPEGLAELITTLVGNKVVTGGNINLMNHYISSTQSSVNRLPSVNLTGSFANEFTKTNGIILTNNNRYQEAIDKSIDLKFWADISGEFSNFTSDASDVLMVTGAGYTPQGEVINAGLKAASVLTKVISFGLVGASIYYPFNRYSSLINNSRKLPDNIAGNSNWFDFSGVPYQMSDLQGYINEVELRKNSYNSFLQTLSTNTSNHDQQQILNSLEVLIQCGTELDNSINDALKPIHASLALNKIYGGLDALYFEKLKQTNYYSKLHRQVMYLDLLNYLMTDMPGTSESLNADITLLIESNVAIISELNYMYNEILSISNIAYIAPYVVDIPQNMISNTTCNFSFKFKNYGTIAAESTYFLIYLNSIKIDSVYIGNFDKGEDYSYSRLLTTSSDTLQYVNVIFMSETANSENIFETIICSNPHLTSDVNDICSGDSTLLSVDVLGDYNYRWKRNGSLLATTQIPRIYISEEGDYTVELNNGDYTFEPLQSVSITEYPTPTVNLGNDVATCFGTQTILNAGAGYTSYIWNGVSTNNPEYVVTNSSIYNVKVGTENGCYAVDTVIVTVFPLPEITYSVVQPICNGNNGSISLNGAINYSYFWPQPINSTNYMVENLNAGTYIVQITNDETTCFKQDTIIVSTTYPPLFDYLTVNNSHCQNNDGIIQFGVTGSYPFNYSLTGASFVFNGSTNYQATIQQCSPDSYQLSITDINNCEISQTITVETTQPIIMDVESTPTSCNSNNGQLLIDLQNGSGNGVLSIYKDADLVSTYNWNSASTTITADNLAVGIYTLFAEDANGCFDTKTVEIINIGNPVFLTTNIIQNVNCYHNGAVQLTANSGTGNYTYYCETQIQNNSGYFDNLQAGVYKVKVVDNTSCSDSTLISIYQLPSPDFSIETEPSLCGSPTGVISTTIHSSQGTTNIICKDHNGFQVGSGVLIPNLYFGEYYLTVQDDNCAITDTVVIENQTIEIDSIASNNVICGQLANATVYAYSLNGISQYLWGNGQQTQTAYNLPIGVTQIMVTDSANCIAVDSVLIDGTIDLLLNISTESSGTLLIEIIQSNGSPYNYSIEGTGTYSGTFDANYIEIENLISGEYLLELQDIANCEEAISFSINVSDIEKHKNNNLLLYPNPTADVCWIVSKSQIKGIEVFNILGNKILEQHHLNTQQIEINLSNQDKGVYLLKVIFDDTVIVLKLELLK